MVFMGDQNKQVINLLKSNNDHKTVICISSLFKSCICFQYASCKFPVFSLVKERVPIQSITWQRVIIQSITWQRVIIQSISWQRVLKRMKPGEKNIQYNKTNNTQLRGWQSRLLPREIHCQLRRMLPLEISLSTSALPWLTMNFSG